MSETLAVNGGTPLRQTPWSGRGLIAEEEKQAALALFDQSIASGNAFGYNGEEEQAYCKEFADFMGGGFADGVNSGTTAVYVALRALNLEPFSEVIVGSITDPGGIMPIPLLNCIPVVADCEPGRYCPGVKEIEKLITPRTSAIIVAHIGGDAADIESIIKLAAQHNLPVIEDCAQAHGTRFKGKLVGTFGSIAAFSTMFGKHHCTGGQGGVVFTKDENLYQKVRWASDRGKPFACPPGSNNQIAALNLNLNDLAGAIGRVQLKKLPFIIEKRQQLAEKLREGMSELKAVNLVQPLAGNGCSYWFYIMHYNEETISCDKNTFVKAVLSEGGPPITPDYTIAMPHLQDWFKQKNVFGSGNHPWSSPEYKGNPTQEFACPEALASCCSHFHLHANEAWTETEIADTIKIFKKVENYYSK